MLTHVTLLGRCGITNVDQGHSFFYNTLIILNATYGYRNAPPTKPDNYQPDNILNRKTTDIFSMWNISLFMKLVALTFAS